LRAAAAEIAVVLDGAPRLVATAPVEGETAAPTTAEAVIEPGPPTRLAWTLWPADQPGGRTAPRQEGSPIGAPRVSGR
jgi:hypothetical protein